MSWFDDPAAYYESVPADAPISQGDLVLAATAVIVPGQGEVGIVGPSDVGERRRVTLWLAPDDAFPAAPTLSADVSWGFAMVVPHPCAMEKEWNERVTALVAQGVPQATAEAQAASENGLDQFISVAPIVPLSNVDPSRRASVSEGNRLGYFPVCPDKTIPPAYADLNQITTLNEELVRVPRRIRALSQKARAKLQLSLSQFYAWRAKSQLGELEAAIGVRRLKIFNVLRKPESLSRPFSCTMDQRSSWRGAPAQSRPAPLRRDPLASDEGSARESQLPDSLITLGI